MQRDEWDELINPLPYLKFIKAHDPESIPVLQKLHCLFPDGHFQLAPGIMCYKTPGHSKGSMTFTVDTGKGIYVILGDIVVWKCSLFPQMDSMTLMDGTEIKITPGPKELPAISTPTLVFNLYDWSDSICLIKTLCRSEEFALTGHDPSLADKVFP